jgi:hypothetical protein
MSETGIETQPVDRGAVISLAAAVLTVLAFCGGIVPVPLTGFMCFPAAAGFGIVAFVAGLASLRRVRSSGEGGRTFALVGTAVGGLALVSLICLLAMGISLYPSLVDLFHRLLA